MVRRRHDSRIAIVGAGVVCPIGNNLKAMCESLRCGRQGVEKLANVPVPRGKDLAGLVHDECITSDRKALEMSRLAIAQALEMHDLNGMRSQAALIISTIAGDSKLAENEYARIRSGGPTDAHLLDALRVFPNDSLLNELGQEFELGGPRFVVTNACASGNIAIGIALDWLRSGVIRAAVVCGVEVLKLSMVWGAERAGFVGRSLRPFDANRDGSVLGEGAGALVLRHADDVEGDDVLAWVEGFGCLCEEGATAITLREDGSGLRRSMSLALADAGRDVGEIQYINAHAPGTPLLDLVECRAIADLFDTQSSKPFVNATKSMTSHLSGASAVVEVIATLLQMRSGFLHANVGMERPDPELPVDVVSNQLLERVVTTAISNACGGGGLNTSVVITAAGQPEVMRGPPCPLSDVVGVTGFGSVSALGAGSGDVFESDCSREPCGPRLNWFDVERWYPKDSKYSYLNRAAQLAAGAAAIAINNSRLADRLNPAEMHRVGVVAGTKLGGAPEASAAICEGLVGNLAGITPSKSLDHGVHLGAALICRHFGFTGPTATLSGTDFAGLQALHVAVNMIRAGRADAVVVVGYDAFDEPLAKVVPWLDDCLRGKQLGEGAAAVVLQRKPAMATSTKGVIDHLCESTAALTTRDQMRVVSDRLADQLMGSRYHTVYVAGLPGERLEHFAELLLSATGWDCPVVCLNPQTNYCLGADGMIAVCAALSAGRRALILNASQHGSLISVSVASDGADTSSGSRRQGTTAEAEHQRSAAVMDSIGRAALGKGRNHAVHY